MSHQDSVSANKRQFAQTNDYDAQPRFQLLSDLFVHSLVNLDPTAPHRPAAESERPLSVADIQAQCRDTPATALGTLVKPTSRIVDFACGTGLVASKLAPYIPHGRVVGIDISRAMLDSFEDKKRAAQQQFPHLQMEAVCGDILDPAFDMAPLAASADIVLCTIAFHHFHDYHQIAAKLKQMAAPGGWIVIYDFYNEDAEKRDVPAEEKARGVSHAGISLADMESALAAGCHNVRSARVFNVCVPQPEKFVHVHCRQSVRDSLAALEREGDLYYAPTSVALGVAQRNRAE